MPIDYKRYPPNWKTEIVPAVLLRAENKCECCGLDNGQIVFAFKQWIKDGTRYVYKSMWVCDERDAFRESPNQIYRTVKVVLTIAHLDHDEENHGVKLDRLKALCQMCHLRYDAKEKYRRSLENWKKFSPINTGER